MRILVTGGAGFIGSHLVEALTARGDRVRVLDDFSTGRRQNLATILPEHLELIEGDVRDATTAVAAAQDMDAIVHLAAVASVQASVDDPPRTHAVNFLGTLNMLEAARKQRVGRFLLASSAAVYGDNPELPLGEDARLQPLTPYAADKLASEHYLDFYHRCFGLQTCAFRFFNIYGPRQDPTSPYSGVISIFAKRIQAGQELVIYGDGAQSRDFVFVADLVRVLVQALDLQTLPARPVNIGTGRAVTLNELVTTLGTLARKTIPVTYAAPRNGDIRHSLAAIDRLKSCFGLSPSVPLKDGLQTLLDSAGV